MRLACNRMRAFVTTCAQPVTVCMQAEETAENLVRGNQLLDSAAKHSRDFR